MIHWAMRDPKRFMREREEVEKLATEVDWIDSLHWRVQLNSSLAVEVDVDLLVHGQPREVTLTYPEVFPETPAYIRPRDNSAHWSGHQFGEGGSFCLEWRADNWQQHVTGADLLRSLYKLLATESQPDLPAEVPSVHQQTRGQEARASHLRFVTTPGLINALSAASVDTAIPIQTNTIFHKGVLVCVATRMGGSEEKLIPIADIPKGVRSISPLCTWKREGFALKVSSAIAASTRTPEEFLRLVRQAGLPDEGIFAAGSTTLKDGFHLVVHEHTGSIQALATENGGIISYLVLSAEDGSSRLPSSHALLKEKRIAIVGLGSLGSKIAVSLARSGCRKFLLVDDDLFLPENICRNELSWASVGLHKAQAVQEALALVATNLEVDVQTHRLAGQESSLSAAKVLKSAGECDLIIDATANPRVFLRLAALAQMNYRAMCWGEVFAGGIGGMIARARPQIDPNPQSVRNAFLRYLEDEPPAPYKNATNYDDVEGEPIVADDADVTQIAAAVARLALDTLTEAQPTAFSSQAYLIGLRPQWIFSSAFDTRAIDVTGEGWDLAQPSEEEKSAAAAMLVDILKEEFNDRPDPSSGTTPNDQSSVA